jgi:hypothetical protein
MRAPVERHFMLNLYEKSVAIVYAPIGSIIRAAHELNLRQCRATVRVRRNGSPWFGEELSELLTVVHRPPDGGAA